MPPASSQDLLTILKNLSSYRLDANCTDSIVWLPSCNGIFTCKSNWDAIKSHQNVVTGPAYFGTRTIILGVVSLLGWLAEISWELEIDCIGREWWMMIDVLCVMVVLNVDTIYSSIVTSLNKFGRMHSLSVAITTNVWTLNWNEELHDCCTRFKGGNELEQITARIGRVMPYVVTYCLQQERNRRVFRKWWICESGDWEVCLR